MRSEGEVKGARVRSLTLSALAFSAILLALLLAFPPNALAEDVTWGDTTVTGDESHTNLTLTLDGNLTVGAPGVLNISHTDIVVNATKAGQYWILVEENATLNLTNVTISSFDETYSIQVFGSLNFENGSITDLEKEHINPTVPRGFVVRGFGEIILINVDVSNPMGYALYINDTGFVMVDGGRLHGASTAVRINGGGGLQLFGVDVSADKGTELVFIAARGMFWAFECTFDSGDVYSPFVHNVAVHILGDENYVLIMNCTIKTAELATVNGGYLEVTGSTFVPDRSRGITDLNVKDAEVIIGNIDMDELMATNSVLELRETTYETGNITNGSVVHNKGPLPALGTMDETVTLHQYYWVDFRLLNTTGEPEEGMDLNVLDVDQVLVVNEALSDADGWIRHVAIRSWTLVGDLLTYEPSHRVEFAGPSYQITNLQVYDNTTVVLWDRVGSYDLVLDTDSITPSTPAPRENLTFNIIVEGEVLLPYTWDEGTAQIDLYVDGIKFQQKTLFLSDKEDVVFVGLNLTPGTHTFWLEVDPDDQVDEMNEGGNDLLYFLLDVAPESGGGDLVDLTVAITKVADVEGNDGDTLVPGVILLDFRMTASNTPVRLYGVPVAVYVDDEMDGLIRVDMETMVGGEFVYDGRFELNLPRGDYVFKVIADPFNEISEDREHNNEDSVRVTLDPDLGDGSILDSGCLVTILFFSIIFIISMYSNYVQRKRQQEALGGDTIQYPQGGYDQAPGGTQTRPRPPQGYPTPSEPSERTPVSLDERWSVERMGSQMGDSYDVDGWESGVAERITAPKTRPPPSHERFAVSGLVCPRCGRNQIIGFSDGSAKCQSCKKIFYPGRR
jgi:hypothetical protein